MGTPPASVRPLDLKANAEDRSADPSGDLRRKRRVNSITETVKDAATTDQNRKMYSMTVIITLVRYRISAFP